MSSPPAVSILLPAWNAGATLRSCLSSIVRQTVSDWECVVVDDGSTDDTAPLLHHVSAHEPRIRVITRAHAGLVPALTTGLAACRGRFVARMDADDVMHRERLADQLRALEADPSLDAVGCHVRLFPRASVSPRLREYEEWLNGVRSADDVSRDAFVECPVAHPTLLMRQSMAALGYRQCGWAEDYDLLLRALSAGLRIGVVPRRLLGWRNGPASLSRTDPRYALPCFTACKAHYLAAGFLRGADDYVLWGYGDTGRALRRALLARGKRPSHVVEVKATRIGQRIHGAPVVPVDAVPALRGRAIIVSVARPGPRAQVRAALDAMGFRDGTDYVCGA